MVDNTADVGAGNLRWVRNDDVDMSLVQNLLQLGGRVGVGRFELQTLVPVEVEHLNNTAMKMDVPGQFANVYQSHMV